MEVIKQEPNFGPSGAAHIAFLGQQIQIVFDANNEVVNLPLSALPPKILTPKKLPANKVYFISVSGKRDSITRFHPTTGSPICKFIGFKHARNQPIAIPEYPREREGKNSDGSTYPKDWLEFTALTEMLEAPYTGMEIPVKLRYYFAQSPTGMAGIKGEGKHSVKLGRFLEVISGDVSAVKVPFSDNILPSLEAVLLEFGRPFMVVMANGWPDSFGEAPLAYLKLTKKKPAAKKAAAKKVTKKTAKK